MQRPVLDIEMTCEGSVIDLMRGNVYPQKGQRFQLQKNVGGEIRMVAYIVEAVYFSATRVQCDCSKISYP